MTRKPIATLLLAAGVLFFTGFSVGSEERAMTLKKLTPVLFVDAIEPCLPFWVDRLGFEKTMEVPDREALGFVALHSGDVEVMLQTRSSLAKDLPGVFSEKAGCFLYIEVADLSAVEPRLDGADIVVPRRKTFYGAEEIGIRDPAGNILIFSAIAP